jgi:hypothetical protein
MLRTILQVSGLARSLAGIKLRLEAKAEDAVKQVKGVAIRIAIAAALAVAAIIFVILALIAGLVALYAYLEPIYGVLPALGVIGGSLVVLALVLLLAASIIGRGKSAKKAVEETAETVGLDDSEVAYSYGAPRSPRRRYATREARAADEVSSSLASLAANPRRRANGGALPDAVSLLQSGDRRKMVAVLGAVAAVGWALGRTITFSTGRSR